MEMLKRLIIAMALAASLVPVTPVYAMNKGLDEEDAYPEDIKEAAAVSAEEDSAAVVVGAARRAPSKEHLAEIKAMRNALTEEARKELDGQLIKALVNTTEDGLVTQEQFDEVQALLENGADANTIDNNYTLSVLTLAADQNAGTALIHLLIDYGADVNMVCDRHPDMRTALGNVVDTNKPLEKATALLARGANPNIPYNKNGDTVLMEAVRRLNPHMVVLLLKAGADVNQRNKFGDTALMHTVFYETFYDQTGALAVKKILVFAGANATSALSIKEILNIVKKHSKIADRLENEYMLSLLDVERLLGHNADLAQLVEEQKRVIAEIGFSEVAEQDYLTDHVAPAPLAHIMGDYLLPGADDEVVTRFVQAQIKDQSPATRAARRAAAMAMVVGAESAAAVAMPVMPMSAAAASASGAMALGMGGDVQEEDIKEAAQEEVRCPRCTLISPTGFNSVCAACETFITSDEPEFFD